jgi:hypothetical protein
MKKLPAGGWRIAVSESVLGESLAGQFEAAERLLTESYNPSGDRPSFTKCSASDNRDYVNKYIKPFRNRNKIALRDSWSRSLLRQMRS